MNSSRPNGSRQIPARVRRSVPLGWSAATTKPCCEQWKDLDVHVVIAAASPWSKRTEGVATRTIPSNVTVRKFTQYELRQLYADSCFMVMPLEDVKFQAGVTAILECLAMGKAVICSRVPGQTDVVVEGENGRYVPPGDPSTLATEIRRLLSRPEEAVRLGANGRKLVECQMNLDLYVQRLADFLHEAIKSEGGPRRRRPPLAASALGQVISDGKTESRRFNQAGTCSRCLIPGFDGAPLSPDSRDALWDRFFTAAPRRQRRSVERYIAILIIRQCREWTSRHSGTQLARRRSSRLRRLIHFNIKVTSLCMGAR